MLDRLLTNSTGLSIMSWRWATEHPYLHTVIEVSHHWLIAIILFLGLKTVNNLFQRRR